MPEVTLKLVGGAEVFCSPGQVAQILQQCQAVAVAPGDDVGGRPVLGNAARSIAEFVEETHGLLASKSAAVLPDPRHAVRELRLELVRKVKCPETRG